MVTYRPMVVAADNPVGDVLRCDSTNFRLRVLLSLLVTAGNLPLGRAPEWEASPSDRFCPTGILHSLQVEGEEGGGGQVLSYKNTPQSSGEGRRGGDRMSGA